MEEPNSVRTQLPRGPAGHPLDLHPGHRDRRRDRPVTLPSLQFEHPVPTSAQAACGQAVDTCGGQNENLRLLSLFTLWVFSGGAAFATSAPWPEDLGAHSHRPGDRVRGGSRYNHARDSCVAWGITT
jgi:hypothetical protein